MNYMFAVYLTHILFVAPLFVYLWYVSTYQNKKLSDNLGILLLVALNTLTFFVLKYLFFLSLKANLEKIPIIFKFLRIDNISKSFLKKILLISVLFIFK